MGAQTLERAELELLHRALAAAKLLGDTGRVKGRLGASLWPVFAIILGIYMIGYTE